MIRRHSESGSELFETSSRVIVLERPDDLAVISSIATGVDDAVLSTREDFVSLLVLMHMIPIASFFGVQRCLGMQTVHRF